jgi:hypothetical protein
VLANDRYFQGIIQSTNKAVESVIIHPDGSWTNKDIDTDHPDAKLLNNIDQSQPTRQTLDRKLSFAKTTEIVSLDDDDEEMGGPTPASLPYTSGQTSTPSRKRSAPQVVDLTLSDEDESPASQRSPVVAPSPAKRVRVELPTTGPSYTQSGDLLNIFPQTQIRSPPLSISPNNEQNNNSIFRFNPLQTMDAGQMSIRRTSGTSFIPATLPPMNQSSPLQRIPSPTLPRHPFSAPNLQPTDTRTNDPPRSQSSSPVLQAFSPRKVRTMNTATNDFRFDWDGFLNGEHEPNSTPMRLSSKDLMWDSQRDDIENEDLELEMARLPSSIFEDEARPGYLDSF